MQKTKTLSVLNGIGFLLQFICSYLTQFKLVNTWTVGEISDRYYSLATPADQTFSIWGVIYTALAVFCLYHIIMAYKQYNSQHPANTDTTLFAVPLIITHLAAIAWLIAWTNNLILLALSFILIQFIALAIAYQRLHLIDRNREPASLILTQIPISIYFAWICVATISNFNAYLTSIGWKQMGISEELWALILVIIISFAGLMMIMIRKNVFFGLVIIWTLYGITLKTEEEGVSSSKDLARTCLVIMAILILTCLVQLLLNYRYKKKKETKKYLPSKTNYLLK